MPHPLILIVGPSGSGKTTLVQSLCQSEFGFAEAISSTTRAMRSGEEQGVHYHFMSHRVFDAFAEDGQFYETVYFDTCKYGILKREIDAKVENGPVLLVVEPGGVKKIASRYHGGSLLKIFLSVDREECRRRMLGRGDSPDKVEARLQNDSKHFEAATSELRFDAIIPNYDLAEAASIVASLTTLHQMKP